MTELTKTNIVMIVTALLAVIVPPILYGLVSDVKELKEQQEEAQEIFNEFSYKISMQDICEKNNGEFRTYKTIYGRLTDLRCIIGSVHYVPKTSDYYPFFYWISASKEEILK